MDREQPLVSVARRSPAERCAFCHDALGAEWDVCSGCNTRLHPECRAQAVECPTLGCRMSVLRRRWAAPGRRSRPAFRRALARMVERHDSGPLGPIDLDGEHGEPEAPRWPTLVLLAHALASPLALLGLAGFFVTVFVPAFWVGLLARRRDLVERARELARGTGSVFSFEAAAAPFFVLGACGLLPVPLAAWLETSSGGQTLLLFVVLGGLLVAIVPPALGWFNEPSS